MRLTSRKSQALLGMLAATENQYLTRAEICSTLWGTREETQARASLRQELASLKRQLGPETADFLLADGERVALDTRVVDTDIQRLSASSEVLEDKLNLLRGPLLQDVDPRESSYDDWIGEARRQMDTHVLNLCHQLAGRAKEQGDWSRVLIAAERAHHVSDYDETALRWKMEALSRLGRRAEAVDFSARFEARLQSELGTSLSPETEALRNALIHGAEATPQKSDPIPNHANSGQLAVFDRPAVLAMPFDVLGSSPEDEELALGLSEDIRTNLARWRWFPVIGSEAVGDMSGDIQTIAAQVGARYVILGSLRRAGDRARVVARLIHAENGAELWSNEFNGSISDVFEFQDHTSTSIVSQIEPQISEAENAKLIVDKPKRIDTWLMLARASLVERRAEDGYGKPEANLELREILEEAVASDPEHGEALARLSRTYFREFLLGWTDDRDAALANALEMSSRAVELDPGSSLSRAIHAATLLFGKRDPVTAIPHAEEAVRLNPSELWGHYMVGCTAVFLGEFDQSYEHYEKVLRLNPNFSNKGALYCDQMMCRALAGRTDEAVTLARRVIAVAPKYLRGLQRCAAVLANAGYIDEAVELLAAAELQGGQVSEKDIRATYPFARSQDMNFLLDGLRRAGWTPTD